MDNISVRKLKLIPMDKNLEVNIDAYKFISDSTHAQYRALNLGMGFMMSTYYKYNMDFKCQEYKDEIRNFKYNLENPVFADIEFGKGIDTTSAVHQKVKKDFSASLKNGLAKGERSATNYKRTFPLMTRGRNLTLFYCEDGEVYVRWVNGIVFKVLRGRRDKDYVEMTHTLNKIVSGEYKIQQSTIEIKGKVVIINLNINMGEIVANKDLGDKIMGIDLGINIPAYASLGCNTYVRKAFGTKDEFIKTREQFRSRRNRTQKQLANTKGGKGRGKKLKALEQYNKKERNWVKTYNHMLSKRIVEFAIKSGAGQINMEKLDKEGFSNSLLGKWSYYELQEMIEYKSEREGIVVKYINPAYTSQKCSKCGHTSKENRQTQEKFICKECGFKLNADHNASINIARSEEYVKKSA